ncbi:hypothetical protein OAS11_01555 [Paracoccaceae bacterium]|jgi:hypothetical protein|nr:hypothetical protein [Paracoccaceae bacterium]
MASNADRSHLDEFEKTAKAIYEMVNTLGEQGINPGCIAACLTMHATQLSFASCEDPTLIFKNLLFAIVDSIPEHKTDFDSDLTELITHEAPKTITN